MRLLFALVLILFSCQSENPLQNENTVTFSGTAMTMLYRIIIGQQLDSVQHNQVQKIVLNTFREIDLVYNKWNPKSELSRLNQLDADVEMQLSPQLMAFLHRVDAIVKLSEGRFDPTIEPLQRLWKSHLERDEIPSRNEIKKVLPAVGWDKIAFRGNAIIKLHSETQLDLGGIAKGYCIDLIAERLKAAGFVNAYIEWGGEIRAMGQHPDQRPWRVVVNAFGKSEPDHPLDLVELHDQAIATSGDYFQYWTVGDHTYTHIVDPQSGSMLLAHQEAVSSVSVIAPSCALADALATIAMLYPSLPQAQAWAAQIEEANPDVKCLFP